MKPLNSQERTKQFFIFLAFYIVTTALVVGVVYFDVDAERKQNVELKKDEKKLQSQNDFYESHSEKVKAFITDINKIRSLSPIEMKSRISTKYGDIDKDLRFEGISSMTQTNLIVNIDSVQYYTLKIIDDYQSQKESLAKGRDSYEELYNTYKTHLESEGNYSPPLKKQF